MEKLLLGLDFSAEELNVINEQDIGFSVVPV